MPLTIGGETIEPLALFTADRFHPGTVLQGLLANSVLQAQGIGKEHWLTDQEILAFAGRACRPAMSWFDVSRFVHNANQPVRACC